MTASPSTSKRSEPKITPEQLDDASDALSGAREGLVVERVMRPIFAAAGRADDLAAPEEHPPLRDIVATRAPADAQWDPAGTR